MEKPQKPKDRDEQISMIWDALYNHVFHRLKMQDIKINFIFGFLALILGLLGILVACGIVHL